MSADGTRATIRWMMGCLALAGCGPHPEPTSPQPASAAVADPVEDPGTPWSKCHEAFTTSGDPTADVGLLGRMCGVKNKQKPLTGVRMVQQSEHDAVDRFTFSAGGPGKCYRVFAVGQTGVRELDVQVVGPGGERLAWDESRESWAAVPARAPLCLEAAGIYTVEVSVYRGTGQYAVQVWSN